MRSVLELLRLTTNDQPMTPPAPSSTGFVYMSSVSEPVRSETSRPQFVGWRSASGRVS
jgi:hypothetical protein